MCRALRWLGRCAQALGVLALPLAWLLDEVAGRDVVWLARVHSSQERAYFAQHHDPRDPLVSRYGVPYRWSSDRRPVATRTLFVDDGEVMRADGERGRTLVMLPVTDPAGDGAPLTAALVYRFARLVALVAGGVGLLLLVLLRLTDRRSATTAGGPGDAARAPASPGRD